MAVYSFLMLVYRAHSFVYTICKS
jgi:hypothetical protein